MTQVDRVDVIAREHWWCPACGTFDGPHDEGFCDVCAEGPGGGTPRVEGLVSLDQLRGAVSDRDALAQALAHVINRVSTEGRDDEHGHIFTVGKAALDHYGRGQ